MKQLRISAPLNLLSYPHEDLSDYIRQQLLFHKEMGFDAADFGMGLLDLSGDGWQPYVEQALVDSKEIGMPIEICHLPFFVGGKKPEEFMLRFNEKMRRAIDAAAMLGVDYAVLHPNTTTVAMKNFNRVEEYDQVMEFLAPHVEYATKKGVRPVVENMRVITSPVLMHRYCQTPDELCEIADALGIGICWDFGHANISGIKQSEGLAYVGKRLKVLHVNDNEGVEDSHILPFDGKIDWRDAMLGLQLAGYEGLFNYELSVGKSPANMRKTYAKYMIDAAHEMMSYINP